MTNVPLFVGMIANSWARLEHAIIPVANRLLRTADDEVGKIVMISLNPPAKRDMLLALASISPLTETQKEHVAAFCAEFERLRMLRNDIVHGRWDSVTETGAPILHKTTARSALKESFDEKEVAWLIKIQSEIEGLVRRAFDLANMMTGLWPSTGRPSGPLAAR